MEPVEENEYEKSSISGQQGPVDADTDAKGACMKMRAANENGC